MIFFDIAEKTADAMPAAMNFPIPDICAQYLGELKLVVSKLIPVEELTQTNLAGNNGSQAIVECQSNVLSLPVPERVSAIWHGTALGCIACM